MKDFEDFKSWLASGDPEAWQAILEICNEMERESLMIQDKISVENLISEIDGVK